MAKLKMKRIEIICAIEDSREFMDFLQRKGVVEIQEYEQDERLEKLSVGTSISQFDKFLSVVEGSMKILDKYAPEKKSLLASFGGGEDISVAEYSEKSENADKILSSCRAINSLAKRIDENKASVVRIQTLSEMLKPWLPLDVPMQFKGTAATAAFIGSFPKEYSVETLLADIALQEPSLEGISAEIISASRDMTCVFILCAKQDEALTEQTLRGLGFVKPADPTKHPPKVRYERYQKQLEALNEESVDCEKKLSGYGNMHRDIEFAHDYFTVRLERYRALANVAVDDKFMVLTGYVPEKHASKLAEKIESKYSAAVSITEPQDDEEVPVLLENNRFSAAVESVTEMYAMPGKDDVDPNPVMAFFYYFLFGIMLSDAGYGVVMIIAMLIAKKKIKLTDKMKKTTDMFLYCGISTTAWGALFGGWFGDIIPTVAKQFFNKDIGSLAIWFEPVKDPMKMLLYSFLFGIIHLFVGLGVKFYMLWKSGEKFAAFCDVIPVYLLVIGIAPIGAGVIIDVNPQISAVGKYVAIAGAVLVVLTSGRSAKNIFGKLGGGLYGLYNIGAGYLGDILSYSRLLALGLSTGVIASVINILGSMASNIVVKAIMLVFVFIFGHTVNIAINLIGTYVHTNRLQYVEFFSKFYEGGGRTFTPLKTNTKYYTIKED